MAPYGNAVGSLVLIALGMLGIILSFLVPDRKKSLIALIMGGVIVLAGVVQYSDQAFNRYRWNKKMGEIQRDRQVDLDELRSRLKDKAGQVKLPATSSNVEANKKK